MFNNTTSVPIKSKDSNGAHMGKLEGSYCLLNPGLDESRLSGIYCKFAVLCTLQPHRTDLGDVILPQEKWGFGAAPKSLNVGER